MKPSYRTPFEGLILRDGQTKGSNPPLRYFWHRWTRSETAPPPVFTSASHPLEIAFLSREGVPDVSDPVGYCMLWMFARRWKSASKPPIPKQTLLLCYRCHSEYESTKQGCLCKKCYKELTTSPSP